MTHAGGRAVVGEPKTAARVRDVLLPEVAARPLRAHMAEHVPIKGGALLWPAADGVSHLRQSTIARRYTQATGRDADLVAAMDAAARRA